MSIAESLKRRVRYAAAAALHGVAKRPWLRAVIRMTFKRLPWLEARVRGGIHLLLKGQRHDWAYDPELDVEQTWKELVSRSDRRRT